MNMTALGWMVSLVLSLIYIILITKELNKINKKRAKKK